MKTRGRGYLLVAACLLLPFLTGLAAVDAPPPNQRLSRALSYQLALPRHVVSRAVSVLGDTSRIKAFANKLLSGNRRAVHDSLARTSSRS
jgi:hypothetical protein